MLSKTCPLCHKDALSYEGEFVTCNNCNKFTKRVTTFQRWLAWADGRGWWWRLPIFGWFVFMLFQNLHDPGFAIQRFSNPFSFLDLGIHEIGHVLFSFFGEFMHIVGGSLFQCLFPLFWLGAFIQKKWYFAAAMCFGWLGLNLFDVATYVADARARLLPLVTPFGFGGDSDTDAAYDSAHDWYQILSRTHHLNSDLTIAHGLRVVATISFLIGFLLGGMMLLQMMIGSGRRFLAGK